MALIQFNIFFKNGKIFTKDNLELQWPRKHGLSPITSANTSPFPSPCPSSSFLLLMTFRLPFSSLYPVTYMSPFNTPASCILLSTSAKPFPSHFSPSSHFISRPLSACWGLLRGSKTPRANTKGGKS